MMALLETVSSGQVACPGDAFGGGGGGSAGVGGDGHRPGRDLGTLVRSNKNRRGKGSKILPFVSGSVPTVDDECFQLPTLQVAYAGGGRIRHVNTAVKPERAQSSVGGLLTPSTLHCSFEALVGAVCLMGKRLDFRIMVGKDNSLQIEFGKDFVYPIQDFECLRGLRTMTWTVCYGSAMSWPLEMVDQLQRDMKACDGQGFFTMDDYLGKRHKKSELHLVMERDEEKSKSMIYAMLPVNAGEIFENPAEVDCGVATHNENGNEDSEKREDDHLFNKEECDNDLKATKFKGRSKATVPKQAANRLSARKRLLGSSNDDSGGTDDEKDWQQHEVFRANHRRKTRGSVTRTVAAGGNKYANLLVDTDSDNPSVKQVQEQTAASVMAELGLGEYAAQVEDGAKVDEVVVDPRPQLRLVSCRRIGAGAGSSLRNLAVMACRGGVRGWVVTGATSSQMLVRQT
jgi:hypothetical protein